MRPRSFPSVVVPVSGPPRGRLGEDGPLHTITEPHTTPVVPRGGGGPIQRMASWPAGPLHTVTEPHTTPVIYRSQYEGAGLGMKVRFLPEATDSNMTGAK